MPSVAPVALEVLVLVLGVVLLLAESFSQSEAKSGMAKLAIGSLAVVFGLSFFTTGNAGVDLANSFYTADSTALFFKRIALLTTMIVLVMSLEYQGTLAKGLPASNTGAGLGEFFALPVFTCAGMMFMASAIDFLLIFVALELVTISFYVMVAYMRRQTTSLEAGVKYLILGALSTGFLVYGITWVFGLTGETNLVKIAQILPSLLAEGGRLHAGESTLMFALMLVLIAFGFKIAAAPFQFWVPDVYQGAPTPITAFLSVGSKAAGFVVLLRILQPFVTIPQFQQKIVGVVAVLAVLSLLYGNLAAMPQDNLKRMLAYSSIGHAGYLLVAVACLGGTKAAIAQPETAVAFYLAGYLLMTLLSFLVMIVVANHSRGDDILHFNGLAKRSPFLAFAMLTAMLSLAGIPFTIGFAGKLMVFATALAEQQYLLIVIGVITVGAGFYYYLRVVGAMYWQEPNEERVITMSPLTRVTIALLIAGIFILGVFPRSILSHLEPSSAPAKLALLPLTP